jgi:hypothetical protein
MPLRIPNKKDPWTIPEINLFRRFISVSEPGGLYKGPHPLSRRDIVIPMTEAARAAGISNRPYSTVILYDCYVRKIRPLLYSDNVPDELEEARFAGAAKKVPKPIPTVEVDDREEIVYPQSEAEAEALLGRDWKLPELDAQMFQSLSDITDEELMGFVHAEEARKRALTCCSGNNKRFLHPE